MSVQGALSLPGLVAESADPAVEPVPASTKRRYAFFVAGEPKPMGSKSAFIVKGAFGPRAVVTDGKAGKAIRGWKDSVTATLLEVMGAVEGRVDPRITGPVCVSLTFVLARPVGHLGKDGKPRRSAPTYPAVKPDLDKLTRSTLDALACVLLADDSRVVSMALAKRYADQGPTGAHVVVEEM